MTNGCLFCMDATKATALEKHPELGPKLAELAGAQTSSLFTKPERAALAYAAELTANREITPTTFAALEASFGEREICDIVWIVASEHLYNLTNIGLNIGSDGFCEIAAAKRRAQ
jgi:alkylhydroperoxidase family enzyme